MLLAFEQESSFKFYHFLVAKYNSIRGFVRLLVRPLVRPSVRPSATRFPKNVNSIKFKLIQVNPRITGLCIGALSVAVSSLTA